MKELKEMMARANIRQVNIATTTIVTVVIYLAPLLGVGAFADFGREGEADRGRAKGGDHFVVGFFVQRLFAIDPRNGWQSEFESKFVFAFVFFKEFPIFTSIGFQML